MSKLCEGTYYTIKGEYFYKCKKTGEVISIKNNKFSYETIIPDSYGYLPFTLRYLLGRLPLEALTYQIHCPSCKDIISPTYIGELGVAEDTISDSYLPGPTENMRADISISKSNDGRIWLKGRAATDCIIDTPEGRIKELRWEDPNHLGLFLEKVDLCDVLSEHWQCEKPYSRGLTELKRFKQGEKLSMEDTIKAHCYDCNGLKASDCGIDYCSMYQYMPYKEA